MPHSTTSGKPQNQQQTSNKLTLRGDGRWSKKIKVNGCWRTIYFRGTEKEALDEWDRTKVDHLAGRKPRPQGEGLSVLELCDRFLIAKATQRDSGELRQLTWLDYKRTAERICAAFGRSRLVEDLRPEDFEALKASFAKSMRSVAIGNEVNRVRIIFKYGYDAGLLLAPIRFGPVFRRPSRKVLRIQRAKQPKKIFSPAEINKLLTVATPQLRAMILLGVNAALGNNDVALLTFAAVDLTSGWLTYPRPKTGIDRRCKLWPETIKALREAIAKRRMPKDKSYVDLVFITAARGSFAKQTTDNPVSKEFAKLLKATGLQRDRRNFYSLRHTFRTVADSAKDVEAIRLIMGHVNEHVEAGYIHFDDDDRLIAVTNRVRNWLFSKKSKAKQSTEKTTNKPRRRIMDESPALRVVG